MDYQRIWAPWRIGYITGQDIEKNSEGGEATPPTAVVEPNKWHPGAENRCFLCRAAALYDDAEAARRQNRVVWEGDHAIALLNRYPYCNGHLLVSPRRHVANLDELTDAEHLEAMHCLSRFTVLLRELLRAEGFNLGLNLGQLAGAGVPGHLHWHLVPRWPGDHNFMSTLADTRVIPQSLDAVWDAIHEALGK